MTPLSLFIKASVLLSLIAIAPALFGRRMSAAMRHLLWTAAVVGLLVLPILTVALPGWTALRLPAPAIADARLVADTTAVESSPVEPYPAAIVSAGDVIPDHGGARAWLRSANWSAALLGIYAAGVLLLVGRLAAHRLSIRRIVRRSPEVRDPEWARLLADCAARMDVRRPVRLLRSLEQTMPMAFGIRRATIVIPAIADTWSDDRRRAVLLHELAHVARHDCLTQLLAVAACAIYWVHPGVWWVARRLRVERELACDDRVLSAGAGARDYAGHLLEIAYALRGNIAPALAVSMAASRQLEGRLLAVLDAARNRTTPVLRIRLAAAVPIGILVVAAATATAAFAPREDVESAARESTNAQAAPAPEARPGTWEIRPTREAGIVHLQLRDENGFYGSSIGVERLSGLAAAQLAGGGPVQFSVRRDAGTFTFEGVARGGVGAGTFTFTPSATFAADLKKRGVGQPTAEQQRVLAFQDVGVAFVDELSAQGYARPAVAQLVRLAEHGVTLSYLRDMGRMGYRFGQTDALIEQRDHDVTPDFIRGLEAQGLKRLSAADLLRARDHDVRPGYVAQLRALGYASLDLDTLIDLRDHDITAEYIEGLATHGYRGLDLELLRNLRNHDVTIAYVNGLSALGYKGLPPDVLLRLRSHDVQPRYVRELQALGYARLSVEELVDLRSHDVQPAYLRELQALGYKSLPIGSLIDLRSHDVEADEVRRANARAGRQLPVDRLTQLAANGWE